jgi:MFS family permease
VTGDRLSSSEKRALLLWVAAGILGILFANRYFFQAFPEASVNLRVTREQALEHAQQFINSLGENVGGYRSSAIFDVDDDAKVYLERELGLKEANRLMASELNLWYWEVRFFKPQQEEEFRVRVTPSGQIAGYEHKVEEKRAGASLERAAAQSLAQNYLIAKLGMNLSGWDVLAEEANSNKRPNRTDWSFTWEKHGFRAKDAPYRLEVSVLGDRIGSSEEILKVPEAWQRSYQRLRSGNDTLTLVFTVPYIVLLATAVWLAIRLTKQGRAKWRGAILLGVVVAALLFLQSLNDWPHWGAGYDTNESYSTFIAVRVASALLISILSAITVTLVLPSAEPLYRESQPDRLQLSQAFTLRGLRSKEFFSATVVGVSMAAVHIGYVVAFYVVASRLGAWAPQDLNFDNSVNTAFPWISGAAIGLLASTNEEFTFRLFAIPFFTKLTRSRWIAVIIPAFMWSFLHSNYPQEPAYIRGIEIGIVGVVAGLVMLRWGIVATLVWHYTVDASLVGLLLLRSNSLYFKVSGVIVAAAALAPLAFACLSYLARGGFEVDEDLLNRAAPEPEVEASKEPEAVASEVGSRRYDALAPGVLGFLAVCLIAGGLLVWRLKGQTIGDYLKLPIDGRAARVKADQILRQRGLDPNSYYHATVLVDIADPVTNEFLRQRVGIAGVNAIYAQRVPEVLWRVRYFRDSQPEEFAVVLRPDGTLHSVRHTLAEETAGASLTKKEAVARAEKFLSEEKKLNPADWNLVESASDKKPHRTDHTLTWQQKEPLDAATSAAATPDHAYARIEAQVLGDEVSNYRTYIKIPDEWRRQREERTLGRVLLSYGIRFLFFIGLGLIALILFLKNLKSSAANSIPWKRITVWSLWALAGYCMVVALGNRLPNFLNIYQTAVPMKMFFGGIAIGMLLGAPLYLGAVALLFALAWYYAKVAFTEENLPGWLGMPREYYRDALLIGLGGSAALLALERLFVSAAAYWPTTHRWFDLVIGQDFDAIVPAAAILGETVLLGLLYTGLVVAISAFVAARVRQPGLRILLFFLGALSLVGGAWGGPADFAKQFLARAILLAVLVIGVSRVMRFNLLGCFLVASGTSLFGAAAELLAQPNAHYRSNGYAVLIALVALYAWPFAVWQVAGNEKKTPSLQA